MMQPNQSVRFRFSGLLFILIVLIGMTGKLAAQTTPGKSLLVLSKGEHVLAIVDPATLKILARIPVGPDPHEVIASSDGRMAYVTNSYSAPFHEINVIDLIAQKPLANIDISPLVSPHGIDFAAGKVWFSAEGSKCVGRYDPAAGKMDWIMGTGQDRTHMIYVTPNGKNVYTTNVNAGTVSILQDSLFQPQPGPNGQLFPGARPRQDWIQFVVPVSKGSEGFDVSPDGRELWTASAGDGTISIVNIGKRQLDVKLNAGVFGANRLKFTPDGKRVLITSLKSGDLFIYDAITRKELKHLNTGHGAAGILIDIDGSRAFLGCTPDNYVAVIDLKSMEVSGHIQIGGPDGLAWSVRP